MNTLKISIVTVVYNAVETIADCMMSVLNQDYSKVEYIIIDGGSTDGTLDVIGKHLTDSIKLVSEPDQGIYDAMNKGIALATGDIVGILNADDRYESTDVLTFVAQAFSQKPIDALCTSVIISKSNEMHKTWRYYNAAQCKLWQFRIGMQPPHPGFFLKRIRYQEFGTYNPTLKISGDFDLLLRMLYIHKLKAYYTAKVTVRMRDGGVSNSSMANKIIMNKENHKALQNNGLFSLLPCIWFKYMFKILQFFSKPPQSK